MKINRIPVTLCLTKFVYLFVPIRCLTSFTVLVSSSGFKFASKLIDLLWFCFSGERRSGGGWQLVWSIRQYRPIKTVQTLQARRPRLHSRLHITTEVVEPPQYSNKPRQDCRVHRPHTRASKVSHRTCAGHVCIYGPSPVASGTTTMCCAGTRLWEDMAGRTAQQNEQVSAGVTSETVTRIVFEIYKHLWYELIKIVTR